MSAGSGGETSTGRPERKGRRVGSLLSAYYRIEGPQDEQAQGQPTATESDLDRQGFDAKRYFDGMVASGHLPDLVKRSKELDSETQSLDGKMQSLVYENYSKFIRATDVIKQMKFTIEGLDPDIRKLDGSLTRITDCQGRVDEGVAGRSQQIEGLLTQQRSCSKLKTIFRLPATLQRCLDAGAYGSAVEAYCCCTPFLRQYRSMPTFQRVLEEVEDQMGHIRVALEQRLRSPDLPVEEAVNSSVTLLDLGEDAAGVTREYLSGRTASLRVSLERCFSEDPAVITATAAEEARGDEADEGESRARRDSMREAQSRPESVLLVSVCHRITELYVPPLCDAVEGFQKLLDGRGKDGAAGSAAGGTGVDEEALPAFVSARVQELCDRLSALVSKKCPPTRVLVSCIHSVRDALRRLHQLLPRLLTKLFMEFLNGVAANATTLLFAGAAAALVEDTRKLQGECRRLQESRNSGLDDVLEEIAKTEQSLIMHAFTALTDCQPLLQLVGTDRSSCQQLVRGLHSQLITFFMAFVEACHTYIGHDPQDARRDPALPATVRAAVEEIGAMQSLEWSGLFALALVRIGRHLEVKAINKVWSVASDLFAGDSGSPDLVANPAVIKATRGAAQAVITHYALVSGQRLAHFFRNSIQNRNWMTVREPRDPRLVVEMVLKEVHAFDAQLARILGDPRKPKSGADQRRGLNRGAKDSMELEMERLWAKKLQVFAPIPFNRNGAVVGILRIAFKALYEYVREETFAKYGLQQIQVDCAFLGEVARDFVEAEDAGVLDGLLGCAVTSAAQRCAEPIFMEAVIVETLCDEKKKSFKFE